MLEKDLENLLAMYPDEFFPGEGFKLIGQQHVIKKRRVDILFEDKYGRHVIIEVKRGLLTREASGQIIEYYGLLKTANPEKHYELILCANTIPKERRSFLEVTGISCKELGIASISEIAKKYDYTFLDDKPSYSNLKDDNKSSRNRLIQVAGAVQKRDDNENVSVWVFQANPNRYDILNALNDSEIGNSIHWLVTRHRNDIQKGHLGLIWLSGNEAGIYALVRIETEPFITKDTLAESKYWVDTEDKDEKMRVRLTVIKRLLNKPILKNELSAIEGLQNMAIIKGPQGTNFKVTDSEWNIISRII